MTKTTLSQTDCSREIRNVADNEKSTAKAHNQIIVGDGLGDTCIPYVLPNRTTNDAFQIGRIYDQC